MNILVESIDGPAMYHNASGLEVFMLNGHIVARISDADYNSIDIIIDDNTSVSTL